LERLQLDGMGVEVGPQNDDQGETAVFAFVNGFDQIFNKLQPGFRVVALGKQLLELVYHQKITAVRLFCQAAIEEQVQRLRVEGQVFQEGGCG
jgi:hypothetical protein